MTDPTSRTAFAPDAARAARLYDAVVAKLADSVAHIIAGCPSGAAIPAQAKDLPERIVAARRPVAEVSCLYFDLLSAALADDVPKVVETLAKMDRDLQAATRSPFFVDWGDLPPLTAERYLRHLNSDPTTPVSFDPPSTEVAARAREMGEAALARLDDAEPELSGEIRALLNDVVLVAGTAQGDLIFDGATSFFCWGTLFLNAEEHGSVIAMIEGLAHESAHALLFGLSQGEPFVLNAADERHPSPLRLDPRPLDGIYHAVFVAARMAYALDRLEAAGSILDTERAEAEAARAGAVRAFFDGHRTLEAHARLTPLGAMLMDDARSYMDRHARDLPREEKAALPEQMEPPRPSA